MDFVEQPTEMALKMWRFGSPQAERLCASLLHSEGFKRIDPQSPLGGPDGLKDVLLDLNGWKYLAAVYFPPTEKTFDEIQKKFDGDLKGVAKNSVSGIAFFTNQKLTPSERETLESRASAASAKAIIYHVEAIRTILDSPRGYGMRLEYLRIPMKPEEQLSFISQFGSGLESAIRSQTELLNELTAKVSDIHSALGVGASQEVQPLRIAATIATRAMVTALVSSSDKSKIPAKSSFITNNLDLSLLSYIHRSMLEGEPTEKFSGQLRSVGVWIGEPGSAPERARFIPPPPNEVATLTDALLAKWRNEYDETMRLSRKEKFDRIVAFHHEFLRIHPFLDGNGRLARLILEQQARELLDVDRNVILEDSSAYFAALQLSHQGDFSELRKIIAQALFGSWDIEQ